MVLHTIVILLIYSALCRTFRLNATESQWRPIPAQRRGPVTDHFRGVFNNLFSGSGVGLEVPKVKPVSHLLQQLFSNDKRNGSTVNNNRVVHNSNDNNHKVRSNFGYTFNEPSFSGKYPKHSFADEFLHSAGGMSDTGFSSDTFHAHHMSPDEGVLYSNPFVTRKLKKYEKKLSLDNQTFLGLDLDQYPEDISELWTPPLPTVDVVYGQPVKGLFPMKPSFNGRSIDRPESIGNSITVHYSKVEAEPTPVRPIYEHKKKVSDNKELYYTPSNGTDNGMEAFNMSETASQLNAVHYIEDLHNKTHMEFNKMSNIFNNYPTMNYTFDFQLINRSVDGTVGVVTEHNITDKIDTIVNKANDSNDYSKDLYSKDSYKKLRPKAAVSSGKDKMLFSPQVLDENFTGLEWKPIMGPIGGSRIYGESIISNKYLESDDNSRLITEAYKVGNIEPLMMSHGINDVDESPEFIPQALYDMPPPKTFYDFAERPSIEHHFQAVPSVVNAHHTAPDPRPVYSAMNAPIEINITPRPVVHRIRDFFRNILYSNRQLNLN